MGGHTTPFAPVSRTITVCGQNLSGGWCCLMNISHPLLLWFGPGVVIHCAVVLQRDGRHQQAGLLLRHIVLIAAAKMEQRLRAGTQAAICISGQGRLCTIMPLWIASTASNPHALMHFIPQCHFMHPLQHQLVPTQCKPLSSAPWPFNTPHRPCPDYCPRKAP